MLIIFYFLKQKLQNNGCSSKVDLHGISTLVTALNIKEHGSRHTLRLKEYIYKKKYPSCREGKVGFASDIHIARTQELVYLIHQLPPPIFIKCKSVLCT